MVWHVDRLIQKGAGNRPCLIQNTAGLGSGALALLAQPEKRKDGNNMDKKIYLLRAWYLNKCHKDTINELTDSEVTALMYYEYCIRQGVKPCQASSLEDFCNLDNCTIISIDLLNL